MQSAIYQALIMYGIAFVIAMAVAGLIKALFHLVRRISRTTRS